MMTAEALEPVNAIASAWTGPLAPATFGFLNMVEFLGGSFLAGKAIDVVSDAAGEVPGVDPLRQAMAEHPSEAQWGEALPGYLMAASSVKNLVGRAIREGLAPVVKQMAGGGIGGGVMETIRPYVERSLEAGVEQMGLKPEQVQPATLRSVATSAGWAALLSGAAGSETAKRAVERAPVELLRLAEQSPELMALHPEIGEVIAQRESATRIAPQATAMGETGNRMQREITLQGEKPSLPQYPKSAGQQDLYPRGGLVPGKEARVTHDSEAGDELSAKSTGDELLTKTARADATNNQLEISDNQNENENDYEQGIQYPVGGLHGPVHAGVEGSIVEGIKGKQQSDESGTTAGYDRDVEGGRQEIRQPADANAQGAGVSSMGMGRRFGGDEDAPLGGSARDGRRIDTLRRFHGGNQEIASHFKRLGIREVKTAGPEAGNGMALHPDGRLFVDHGKLEVVLGTVGRKYRGDFGKTLKVEEMIHRAHDLVQPENRLVNRYIFNSLSDLLRVAVMHDYASSIDPQELGGEFLRMLIQLRNGMPLSESFHTDTTELEQLLHEEQGPYVENLVQRVSARLLGTDGWRMAMSDSSPKTRPGKPKNMGSPFDRDNVPGSKVDRNPTPQDFTKKAHEGNLTENLKSNTYEHGQMPAIARRISAAAARTLEADGEGALRDAAEVAASVYRPGASASEPEPGRTLREAETLRQWAGKQGLILPSGEFDRNWRDQGKLGGSENAIYFTPDGKTVFKRNNLSFHNSYLEYFERLALHNHLFPQAKLHFVGFTDVPPRDLQAGEFAFQPVVSQDFIESAQPPARKSLINRDERLGF